MARYAKETIVSADQSRLEIEKLLTRYGATAFMYAWEEKKARIQFRAKGRYIRFDLPLPDRYAQEFTHTAERQILRSFAASEKAFDQAVRSRWRALLLVIKAKMEAVEVGIVTFEDEFLAHTVLPDNSTAGEWMKPQIKLAYDRGEMPLMLSGPKG